MSALRAPIFEDSHLATDLSEKIRKVVTNENKLYHFDAN